MRSLMSILGDFRSCRKPSTNSVRHPVVFERQEGAPLVKTLAMISLYTNPSAGSDLTGIRPQRIISKALGVGELEI